MKINRKTVLTTAAVLGVVALAAGGTMAYFTDKEETNNQFTVGNVDITLYESQLHRENSGRMGNFPALASDPDYCDWTKSSTVVTTAGDSSLINGSYEKARYCTPNMDVEVARADGITAVKNGHTASNRGWGFSDAVIKADAETYKATDDTTTTDVDESGYFTRVSQNIVPGQWVRKFAYVTNESESSDAFVLIRYMVPTSYAANVDVKVPGTPYEEDVDTEEEGLQPYFTAVTKNATTGKYEAYALTLDSNNKPTIDAYTGYTETINNVEYRVYAAVTTDVVKPGEMTFWSPVNTVRLKTTVTNVNDPEATVANPNYVAPASQIDVKVDAQAIQAKTFANAIEAINNL